MIAPTFVHLIPKPPSLLLNILFLLPHTHLHEQGLCDRGWCPYVYVCGQKKLNRTLAIDSPFQTFVVGLLVEFIDYLSRYKLKLHAPLYISPIFNCIDLRVSRSLRSLANYIPPLLTVHFPMTHSVRYQPILHTLYYTLHTEHAYCLSYRFLNNVVTTTVIEMVEMVEILDARLGKRSVEPVRYVINNSLHLDIVKYGVISLILCITTHLRLVIILSLLMKYLVILHADPCNKSYILNLR